MHNGKIGTFAIQVESARGTAHPPVLANLPFKPGQGVLPAGLLLQESASGLVPYDSGTLVGVNDSEVDTGKRDSGLVIVHGSAIRELLHVGLAAPAYPDETVIAALFKLGVYPE